VVDCANGAAYRVAPEALWELGAEVISIGVEPNGLNINRDSGSTAPQALIAKVRERRADIGIALDGDADRIIMVDEHGHLIDGDQILAVIAEDWQEDGRLARPGVVATIMSNIGLERRLQAIGLSLVRTAVGDHHVFEEMRLRGYNIGGEPNGHIILSDHATTADGFIAALQMLAVVKRLDKPASIACRRFDPVPQLTKNVHCSNSEKNVTEDAKIIDAIFDATQRLDRSGRLIVRPSGTEPVIRVTAEGDDPEQIELAVDRVVEALSEAMQR
jgi:phosphoglucosamine mutase